ncbi:ead/Ea22-like family protein, partial [Enterobacter asburiae]|uniref:ead/Ea22-like family protein n=1 Tax=Enterobacter asburiae TaxID=61645 RepID=UPI002FF759DC
MSNIDKHIDKQALREMAERAASDSWGYDRDEFNDAITPEVALALLDELEAAEKRIAELERKEQHSERQSVIDALAGSGEEWS